MKYLIAAASISFVIAAPAFAGVGNSDGVPKGWPTPIQLAQNAPALSSVFGGFGITYPEGTGFGRELKEGAREVDFFYEWSGAKPGEHHIEVHWLKDGQVISQSSNTIDAVAGKTNIHLKMSNGEPLSNGSYKVEWTDNGQPMPATDFTIGKPSGDKATQQLHEALQAADAAQQAAMKGAPAGSVVRSRGIKSSEIAGFDTDFPEGVHQVDYWYEWSGAQPGRRVDVRWLKDGAAISEGSDTINSQSGTNNVHINLTNGAPLPNGSYQVVMIEDGKAWPPLTFTIGKSSVEKAAAAMPDGDLDAAMRAGDYQRAVRLLEPPATAGNTKAQVLLGTIYSHGETGMKNYAEAVKWLQPAAEHGDSQAQSQLGVIYAGGGDGVAQDWEQSGKWYRLAAEQGEAYGQRALGGYYVNGVGGLPRDYVQGYMWEALAIRQLDGDARDIAVQIRDFAAQQMTPEQKDQAEHMAKDWKPKTP